MNNVDNDSKKINLITLLLLLMIFSMYFVVNVNTLVKLNTSIISPERPIYSKLLVPLAMGIALLYSAIKTSNKRLRLIYIVAIMPFLLSPDVLIFINNRMFIHIINIAIDFLVILLVLGHIVKNYH